MRPALDERTAPGPRSGAVRSHPTDPDHPAAGLLVRERDYWRAVAASALATLRPWLR
jgi:hypothetical protein